MGSKEKVRVVPGVDGEVMVVMVGLSLHVSQGPAPFLPSAALGLPILRTPTHMYTDI